MENVNFYEIQEFGRKILLQIAPFILSAYYQKCLKCLSFSWDFCMKVFDYQQDAKKKNCRCVSIGDFLFFQIRDVLFTLLLE